VQSADNTHLLRVKSSEHSTAETDPCQDARFCTSGSLASTYEPETGLWVLKVATSSFLSRALHSFVRRGGQETSTLVDWHPVVRPPLNDSQRFRGKNLL
jgi:hypothetical protein